MWLVCSTAKTILADENVAAHWLHLNVDFNRHTIRDDGVVAVQQILGDISVGRHRTRFAANRTRLNCVSRLNLRVQRSLFPWWRRVEVRVQAGPRVLLREAYPTVIRGSDRLVVQGRANLRRAKGGGSGSEPACCRSVNSDQERVVLLTEQ